MDILAVLYLVGAVQALLLAVTLVSLPRANRRANICLGLFLAVFAVDLLDYFLLQSELYRDYPQLISVVVPFTFGYGPLLYFYVRFLTDEGFRLQGKHGLHLLPVLFASIALLPFYMLSNAQKSGIIDQPVQLAKALMVSPFPFELFGILLMLSQIASVALPFAYAVFIYKRLKKHRRNIRQAFSNEEQVNLAWLNHLLFIAIGLSLVYLLTTVLQGMDAMTIETDEMTVMVAQQIPMLMPIAMSLTALYLGVMALRQPAIVHTLRASHTAATTQKRSPDSPQMRVKSKYQKSALTLEQAMTIQQRLLLTMNTEKTYTNSNLTLPILAQCLDVPTHQLSQVLNETLQSNFFDFINHYRIEQAKHLLADPNEKNSPILAIAMEVGYKSKSAFYRVFKHATGLTPSAYREQKRRSA